MGWRIGVVGGGTVGRAIARSYIEWADEVHVYDVVKERCTASLDTVLGCRLVFVCLPTPQKKDSLECDTSAVEDFCQLVDSSPVTRNTNLVLKSTVPIGTTRRLVHEYMLPNLVYSPEFLTARCALVDACLPSRNIIGSREVGENLDPAGGVRELHELYASRFPEAPILSMTYEESEAVKLFQNSFFAVKVSYWNEVRTLADKLGLNWDRVMKAILADGRIHPSHTQVPGPDGKFGWGGSCLPKDLASLVHQLLEQELLLPPEKGTGPLITKAALERNSKDRKRGG